MSKLEYRKNIEIKYKVFKKGDIIRIAHIIEKQFENTSCHKEIKLRFVDSSQISGDDISIFDTPEFDRKLCKEIDFTYYDFSDYKKIEICLYNSEYHFLESSISVAGNNQEWYDSTINKFNSFLMEVENQKKYMLFLLPLLIFVFSFIESLLYAIATTQISATQNIQGIFILMCIILMLLNIYLSKPLYKLYPKIEFAFGPNHLNRSLKLRKSLKLIIPFAVDLLLFLIGLYVK